MNDIIQVNTTQIKSAAEEISRINKDISEEFKILRTKIKSLDNSWDGIAAASAMEEFNNIFVAYQEARQNEMGNYSRFLLEQIGEGYEETETVNKSLADAFK